MINLDEHKFFEYQRKMDVVPYSIAVKAVEEALESINPDTISELEKAMKVLQDSMKDINNIVEDIEKIDD